jgi:RimJ/RimL family protein N-acetyltransferase
VLGPILRGHLVTLVPTPKEMIELWPRWTADRTVTLYLLSPFVPSRRSEDEWYTHVCEDRNTVHWAIEVEEKIVGSASINDINWQSGHGTTGIAIGEKSYWHRGVATEAMALRTRFAFEELNLHKLKTEVFMENEASRRALVKAGYRQVGLRRQERYADGRWHDLWLGELLREDWELLRPK